MEVKKILMVDDSEIEYLMVKDLFDSGLQTEYELFWEFDFEVALKDMSKNFYDAYIVDYLMGLENGIDLIRQAKQRGMVKPVVLLTGFGGADVDEEAKLAGADDYLVKDGLTFFYLEKSIRYAIERRRLELGSIERKDKHSHALRMSTLGQLSSSVAHEINNPLNIIFGYTDVLKDLIQSESPQVEEMMAAVEKIEAMTQRVSKTVKSLYSFSRNTETDSFEQAKLSSILSESIELCKGRISANGIELRMNEIQEEVWLDCKPGEIIQVVVNLVTNAIDAASAEKGGWVEIKFDYIDKKTLKLSVIDSGSGVPESIRSQILEPYFTTKKSGSGIGLGLSICKMIIESHNGGLYLDYKAKQTCFVVELPIFQDKIQAGE